METLWTVKEVADFLGLKVSTIYNWAQTGRLPAIKIGRTWRFDMERLIKWIERHSQDPE